MITEKLAHLVTVTESAGITATLNPPKISAPGAWISATRLEQEYLIDAPALVADIYLISRDWGVPAALDTLDDMTERLIAALDNAEIDLIDSALGETVTLPNTPGSPLPSFRFTVKL